VLKCDNGLGEAPMYNSEEHSLYWLDISGQKLWKFTPGNCFLQLAIFFPPRTAKSSGSLRLTCFLILNS
jgi:sugar lactone lactonase YvrE